LEPLPFRFDAIDHLYLDLHTEQEIPHITGMLQRTGWVDDLWMTEDGRERGQQVHRLTADYDLGALEPSTCVSRYRPYLLGHVKAMSIIRPTWHHVEEPLVSTRYRFGGRPDRVGVLYGGAGVLEVKSGAFSRANQIQTALQAILVSDELGIPPELLLRFSLYLTQAGKFKLDANDDRRDFDEAYRIIKRCCHVAA
jgi:hypothetical protein